MFINNRKPRPRATGHRPVGKYPGASMTYCNWHVSPGRANVPDGRLVNPRPELVLRRLVGPVQVIEVVAHLVRGILLQDVVLLADVDKGELMLNHRFSKH